MSGEKMTSDYAELSRFLRLYQGWGVNIIPIASRSKKPHLETWMEYQSRRSTQEEIDEWFARADVNVGIVCGSISGNLVVIDFDDPQDYQKFFDTKKIESETIVVKTSRGFQVYLKAEQPVRSAKIPELHMEIRSDGQSRNLTSWNYPPACA